MSLHPDNSGIDERFLYRLRDTRQQVRKHSFSYFRLLEGAARWTAEFHRDLGALRGGSDSLDLLLLEDLQRQVLE